MNGQMLKSRNLHGQRAYHSHHVIYITSYKLTLHRNTLIKEVGFQVSSFFPGIWQSGKQAAVSGNSLPDFRSSGLSDSRDQSRFNLDKSINNIFLKDIKA